MLHLLCSLGTEVNIYSSIHKIFHNIKGHLFTNTALHNELCPSKPMLKTSEVIH